MPKQMITFLRPQNFLSFGPDFPGIKLGSLSILVGPNGCGKSNLLEAVSFMRAAPRDFRDVTRKGGGVGEWIWKGDPKGTAEVEIRVPPIKGLFAVQRDGVPLPDIAHHVEFEVVAQSFRLKDERIEEVEKRSKDERDVYFYYRYQHGSPMVNTHGGDKKGLARDTLEPNLSILAQRRDPETYPHLARLAQDYERVRIYREWTFGRNAVFREPQKADARNDALAEDFSNLGLVLNRLRVKSPKTKRQLLEKLRDLYGDITDFDVSIEGGTVQVIFSEGDFSIPATRLSDGTLRYLCLLAILLDPEPPPLVCIEEPELGLHPDLLPTIADLLVDLSTRTQVIATTHSEMLVDCMTERPESVVVCEKHEGKTEMRRLSSEELKVWLEHYRLGQL
jgi:predicted ATPase